MECAAFVSDRAELNWLFKTYFLKQTVWLKFGKHHDLGKKVPFNNILHCECVLQSDLFKWQG